MFTTFLMILKRSFKTLFSILEAVVSKMFLVYLPKS